MHTFRDAIDVNYQRMALTGEELSGVPLEDFKEAARQIIYAIKLRKIYMERIGRTSVDSRVFEDILISRFKIPEHNQGFSHRRLSLELAKVPTKEYASM